MKIVVALVLIALLILGFLLFRSNELDKSPSAAEQAANAAAARPKQDFHGVTALIQQDMSNIPASLEAPRQTPAHAYDIKQRLAGALDLHEEYRVLSQACDLVIFADQEHSVRQRQLEVDQHQVSVGALDSTHPGPAVEAQRAAIRQNAQKGWDDYRRGTDAEVRRLLGTLQDKRL